MQVGKHGCRTRASGLLCAGTRLQRTSILESLGGHFVLGPDPDSPDTSVFPAGCRVRWRQLHDAVLGTAARFGRLSVGWELRSADIAALLPAITYLLGPRLEPRRG